MERRPDIFFTTANKEKVLKTTKRKTSSHLPRKLQSELELTLREIMKTEGSKTTYSKRCMRNTEKQES